MGMTNEQAYMLALTAGSKATASATVSATEAWLAEHVDPDTGYVIDDTLAVTGAAADAKKVGDEITDLKSAISVLEPDATSSDVGKALKVKTVSSGKVTEYEFGDLAVIDDTLTHSGEAADAKATGDAIAAVQDMVIISGTQPSAANNKIWVDSSASQNVQVPTMDDLLAALITESDEDDIVHITDGVKGGFLFKSLKADLDYKHGGYTAVTLVRTNKNFFPDAFPANTIKATFVSNGSVTSATNARVFSIPCKPNTNYIASCQVSAGFTIGLSTNVAAIGNTVTYVASMVSRTSYAFNSGDNSFIIFAVALTELMTNNATNYKFQVELGSTATTFEEGKVFVTTIDLSSLTGTVYGGEIDFTAGKVTSTLDSSGDALAEAVEYDITAVPVAELYGDNTLFADSGDLTVDYYADAKLYIDKQINALS